MIADIINYGSSKGYEQSIGFRSWNYQLIYLSSNITKMIAGNINIDKH